MGKDDFGRICFLTAKETTHSVYAVSGSSRSLCLSHSTNEQSIYWEAWCYALFHFVMQVHWWRQIMEDLKLHEKVEKNSKEEGNTTFVFLLPLVLSSRLSWPQTETHKLTKNKMLYLIFVVLMPFEPTRWQDGSFERATKNPLDKEMHLRDEEHDVNQDLRESDSESSSEKSAEQHITVEISRRSVCVLLKRWPRISTYSSDAPKTHRISVCMNSRWLTHVGLTISVALNAF